MVMQYLIECPRPPPRPTVWTSGGVAAGIDMALALIATLVGEQIAVEVAEHTEYEWHTDSSWDPFAKIAGLV